MRDASAVYETAMTLPKTARCLCLLLNVSDRETLTRSGRIGGSKRAVHSGEQQRHGGRVTSTTTPIYRTATFIYDTAEELDAVFGGEAEATLIRGWPTRQSKRWRRRWRAPQHCVSFGSGMAARGAARQQRRPEIVAARDLYAATYTLLNAILNPLGVQAVFVDMHEPGALEGGAGRARDAGGAGRGDLQSAAARGRPGRRRPIAQAAAPR